MTDQHPPTPDELAAIRHNMRCEVTLNRCDEYGCDKPGAHVMPPDWRCGACTAYKAFDTLLAAVDQHAKALTAIVQRIRAEERRVLALHPPAYSQAAELKRIADEIAALAASADAQEPLE